MRARSADGCSGQRNVARRRGGVPSTEDSPGNEGIRGHGGVRQGGRARRGTGIACSRLPSRRKRFLHLFEKHGGALVESVKDYVDVGPHLPGRRRHRRRLRIHGDRAGSGIDLESIVLHLHCGVPRDARDRAGALRELNRVGKRSKSIVVPLGRTWRERPLQIPKSGTSDLHLQGVDS